MAKITELPSANSVSGDDFLVFVDDPENYPVTKHISVANLLSTANSAIKAANLIVTDSRTPANSTITVAFGSIFYDANYLYIATANNNLKRISLSSF